MTDCKECTRLRDAYRTLQKRCGKWLNLVDDVDCDDCAGLRVALEKSELESRRYWDNLWELRRLLDGYLGQVEEVELEDYAARLRAAGWEQLTWFGEHAGIYWVHNRGKTGPCLTMPDTIARKADADGWRWNGVVWQRDIGCDEQGRLRLSVATTAELCERYKEETVSERCRRTGAQFCHVCDDLKCGDNLRSSTQTQAESECVGGSDPWPAHKEPTP